MHAVHRCMLIQLSLVAGVVRVSVCVLVTSVSCAKTAELTEMLCWVYNHVMEVVHGKCHYERITSGFFSGGSDTAFCQINLDTCYARGWRSKEIIGQWDLM